MYILLILLLWTWNLFSKTFSQNFAQWSRMICCFKKSLRARSSDRLFLPQNSHHDGIYADVLRNPSDLSPQLDYCSVAITVTHITTNVNNLFVRKVRKEELIFLMLIVNFDFFN